MSFFLKIKLIIFFQHFSVLFYYDENDKKKNLVITRKENELLERLSKTNMNYEITSKFYSKMYIFKKKNKEN